jgi:hypothetical protein
MVQTHTISRNNTVVVPGSDYTAVILHQTEIVRVFPDRVELDTGGWLTTTTITRINQTANQMRLGFSVSRKGGKLSAYYRGRTWESSDDRTLTLPR